MVALSGSGAVQPTKDAAGHTNPTDAVVACNPAVGKAVVAVFNVGNEDVTPLKFDVGNEDVAALFIPAVGKLELPPATATDVGNALWTEEAPPEVAVGNEL